MFVVVGGGVVGVVGVVVVAAIFEVVVAAFTYCLLTWLLENIYQQNSTV